MVQPDKMIPQNVEAEESVLGSLLIDPEALFKVQGFLTPDDFYIRKNGWVYEAIESLDARDEPVDFVTLCDELERNERLAEIGGAAYITRLVNAVPSAIHVRSYAQIVRDASFRRSIIVGASDMARAAGDNELTTDEVADQVDGIVTAVLDRGRSKVTKRSFDVARAVYDEAERYSNDPLSDGQVRGVDTGWRDLNKALGGWRNGLYVVLAVPHLGKTWFVLHSAAAAARQSKRVLFFTLEMTAEQLVKRLCMAHANVSREEYESGRMTSDQWEAFTEMATEIAEQWHITFDDVSETLQSITATIRREHRENPLGLVVVDYLGLIECPSSENRNLQIGGITRRLKNLSRTVGVPILMPHQISDKNVDSRSDKRPMASDGYESGHIHQDVDVLLGLYRDDKYHLDTELRNILQVLNLKDRFGGGSGSEVHLVFGPRGQIMDARRYAESEPIDSSWYGYE